MEKFVFNDETVENSYGFKIKTSGIELERFLANPVMLDDHVNSTNYVIGKWNDTKVESRKLVGVPEFDTEDENAKRIEGKVTRGYIRGCSMGISYDREYMTQLPDGSWVLEKCTLFEVSICAIPSNARSLRLYDAKTQKLLTESEVKLSLQELQGSNPKTTMEKIKLSTAALTALSLDQQPETEQELNAAIATLSQKLTDEKNAHKQTKTELSEIAKTQAKELVKQAKLAGKITEAEVPEWEKMAESNLSLATAALAKIPAKQNLSVSGVPPIEGVGELPKTPDDFEKLSAQQKADFKANHPDEYKALWN